MNKTIFITGASSGLGKATAKLFAEQGWNVIATMRKPENETELDKIENITVLPLDVTNTVQIQSTAAASINLRDIDVVFNNAGYGLGGVFEATTDEQLTRQINTNLLGVMRVTQAFIPHFRQKKSGMFITTTSIGGLMAFPFFSVYHATKWALEGWSESLAFELGSHNVQVKTVSPGGILTDFAGRSLDMSMHEAYTGDLQKLTKVMLDPERQKNYSTAEQIANVVYEAATDGQSKLRYVAGEDAKAMYAQRKEIGDEAFRTGVKEMFLS
ncbi:MAG: SDR family oxidoreductase [Winogradskyella sp.]|uniref:SDR family oxidoreductase n=1 Tax=Winogradskyella sp. TaxID=1883156 RepID=UPI000F4135BB|nr:SDR family oxidoreductase [Winogradskyella sp.]RNC84839.1 MAG: SDR family oxidoreductase [Winogradskyella sp.]